MKPCATELPSCNVDKDCIWLLIIGQLQDCMTYGRQQRRASNGKLNTLYWVCTEDRKSARTGPCASRYRQKTSDSMIGTSHNHGSALKSCSAWG